MTMNEEVLRIIAKIIKRIEDIELFIKADEELGCGISPAGFYDPLYEQIDELEDKLAQLQEGMTMKHRNWIEKELGRKIIDIVYVGMRTGRRVFCIVFDDYREADYYIDLDNYTIEEV